jgi:predicted DNA-binding protein (MmcQ/YjbR family)
LRFDGAYEDYPWGETVFKVRGKIFATISGDATSLKVSLKATPDDAAALTQLEGITPARYVGRYGWLEIVVPDEGAAALVQDLITASYALVAAGTARRPRRSLPPA